MKHQEEIESIFQASDFVSSGTWCAAIEVEKELHALRIKKELDRVEIHTLREALYGAIHQLRQYAHRDEDYRRSIEKYMKILEP